MNQQNIIDLVIEKKRFKSCKVISQGKFSATIEVDYQEKEKKKAMLILSKAESDNRRFEFEMVQNGYTIQALDYEYMCKLQTYIIYTECTEYTLQDKIADKVFRKSTVSIELVCNWIKEISLGLKKIHNNSYVHLNIHPKIILITSDNKAKIGGFDFLRHSSTQTSSSEYGSELHYHPPETVPSDFGAIDGKKFDVWCLTMLAVESLTGNYIAGKSTKVTSRPEQYRIIHKILQPPKFKKVIKQSYPKAAKGEYLEQILRLIKHTMKCQPDERPNISEFALLMLELTFLKYIDKELVPEAMWNKKVSLKEFENKFQTMDWGNKPSEANHRKKNKYCEEVDNKIIHKPDQSVNINHSHSHFSGILSNKSQKNLAVKSNDESKDITVTAAGDCAENKMFSGDFGIKEKEYFVTKESDINRENRMMGDIVINEFDNRNKEIKAVSSEYSDAYLSETSSSEKRNSVTENVVVCKENVPDPHALAKNDLIKNTDEEIFLSKKVKDSSQSHTLVPDIESTNAYITEKDDAQVTSETFGGLNEKNGENMSRSKFATNYAFRKVVNWVFDEKFYIGVTHSGSFINRLSKALTG